MFNTIVKQFAVFYMYRHKAGVLHKFKYMFRIAYKNFCLKRLRFIQLTLANLNYNLAILCNKKTVITAPQ